VGVVGTRVCARQRAPSLSHVFSTRLCWGARTRTNVPKVSKEREEKGRRVGCDARGAGVGVFVLPCLTAVRPIPVDR
jgi:hypothetical protein